MKRIRDGKGELLALTAFLYEETKNQTIELAELYDSF
jgi:hypothetical protein